MGYYNRYNYYNNNDDFGTSILKIIGMIILLIFLMNICDSCSISDGREEANMIYIEEGFCYDADTQFIYREIMTGGGRTAKKPTYTIYINENGNYCKYEYGKWVEFIK